MSKDLKERTKKFSISIIKIAESFDYSISKKIILNQLVKAGTSTGANYRAATRSRSDREFISKLNIILEEVDETAYWLEIIQDFKWADVDKELKEANELTAIFVTILKKMNSKE